MEDSARLLEAFAKLHPKTIDLELTRMQRLLAKLGHPEERLPPVIHVAGTNGKGSTIAFLRSMLSAGGYGVHVYTSPHLVRFHERIRLGGQLISEDRLTDVLRRTLDANDGDAITYFEATTAAAFVAFAGAPADVLLLEVGLGGRFDATNVIDRPALTLITPVGLDHQDYLGDTLSEIAGEKAGILKAGVPALIGPQEDEARARIEAIGQEVGAPLNFYGQEWMAFAEHGRLVVQDETGLADLPLPRLPGHHQLLNAGLAVAALRQLSSQPRGPALSEKAMSQGLEKAIWPGRLQHLPPSSATLPAGTQGLEVWLDGGHNPHAASALAQTMADLNERDERPLYLIVAMMEDKDDRAFLRAFDGLAAGGWAVAVPGESRSRPATSLAQRAEGQETPFKPAASWQQALASVKAKSPQARVLICGSLFLAGDVLRGDPPV